MLSVDTNKDAHSSTVYNSPNGKLYMFTRMEGISNHRMFTNVLLSSNQTDKLFLCMTTWMTLTGIKGSKDKNTPFT